MNTVFARQLGWNGVKPVGVLHTRDASLRFFDTHPYKPRTISPATLPLTLTRRQRHGLSTLGSRMQQVYNKDVTRAVASRSHSPSRRGTLTYQTRERRCAAADENTCGSRSPESYPLALPHLIAPSARRGRPTFFRLRAYFLLSYFSLHTCAS